jgi:hypothetical protein
MNLLADAIPTEVTPAVMGMAVIILLQLSQFFFALRKDMRQNDAAKKEDLTALRTELLSQISEVTDDVDALKESIEKKMEASRLESNRARTEIHDKIEKNALKTAALVEGQETIKQTLISVGTKLDQIRMSAPSSRR